MNLTHIQAVWHLTYYTNLIISFWTFFEILIFDLLLKQCYGPNWVNGSMEMLGVKNQSCLETYFGLQNVLKSDNVLYTSYNTSMVLKIETSKFTEKLFKVSNRCTPNLVKLCKISFRGFISSDFPQNNATAFTSYW